MSGQKHIPADDKRQPLDEGKLMAYLEGHLTAAEQHEVELWLSDEGMESDAIEGLKQISPTETRNVVHRLDHDLKRKVARRKKKDKLSGAMQVTWIAIGLVLLICIAAYLVIHFALKPSP